MPYFNGGEHCLYSAGCKIEKSFDFGSHYIHISSARLIERYKMCWLYTLVLSHHDIMMLHGCKDKEDIINLLRLHAS